MAVRAEGSWIEDESGRRWLDASGGAVVANLGHGGPLAGEIADAVGAEIRTLGYINGTQFTHRAVEDAGDASSSPSRPAISTSPTFSPAARRRSKRR